MELSLSKLKRALSYKLAPWMFGIIVGLTLAVAPKFVEEQGLFFGSVINVPTLLVWNILVGFIQVPDQSSFGVEVLEVGSLVFVNVLYYTIFAKLITSAGIFKKALAVLMILLTSAPVIFYLLLGGYYT